MKTTAFLRSALLVAALLAGPIAVRAADDLGAVKARMSQRVGAVSAAKARQVAGENNQGYLEVRGQATAAEQKTIADENADRRAVYQALAAQTGTTPETVGKHRAQQLAGLAQRGEWFQDAGGTWRQKD
ncbi:MAG: YdbL family protein [Opitutaceae bacterium]|nr:YdbL family protein [Opitutaceae bacterium]